jgi:hypothetical protein
MSGFTSVGIAVDTVTTDQQCPLGFQLTVPNGDFGLATYVYVKTAGAITAGAICGQSGTVTPYLVIETGAAVAANEVYGAAQVDIASGSYGFILAKGYCPKLLCTSATSPAPGQQIASAANGLAVTNALGTDALVSQNIGVGIGAAPAQVGGAGAYFGTALLDCGVVG